MWNLFRAWRKRREESRRRIHERMSREEIREIAEQFNILTPNQLGSATELSRWLGYGKYADWLERQFPQPLRLRLRFEESASYKNALPLDVIRFYIDTLEDELMMAGLTPTKEGPARDAWF